MYCPNCGTDAPQHLRYCKRCGANLQGANDPIAYVPPKRSAGLAWALALATVAITLGGLGIVFGMAGEMSIRNASQDVLIAMIMLGSLTVFGVAALLIRLFSRLLLGEGKSRGRRSLPDMLKNRIIDHDQQQIGPPPRSISSVTEHTTRNFDPSNLEQRER